MDKQLAPPLWLTFLISLSFSIQASPIEKILEASDNSRMARLERIKQSHEITPFTTDGCSGGLTQGWKFFSRFIPSFRTTFGEQPPWEECCITHDRAYWHGDTIDGYRKRKQADEDLKQCVIMTGRHQSPLLSTRWAVPEAVLLNGFNLTAEMMYQAVRVGGQPCSGLPWRWGYGWPECGAEKRD